MVKELRFISCAGWSRFGYLRSTILMQGKIFSVTLFKYCTQVTWFRGEKLLQSGNGVTMTTDEFNHKLEISDCSLRDDHSLIVAKV